MTAEEGLRSLAAEGSVGAGGSSVYHPASRDNAIIIFQGPECAILKKKSYDLLTALNGQFKGLYYSYTSCLACDRQRGFCTEGSSRAFGLGLSFLPEVMTGSRVPV